MLFSLSTAFKNLNRAKVRSLVTISTAAFGIMGYLFFSSLNQGTNEDTIRAQKTYITGESQLLLKTSFDDLKNVSFDNLFDYSSLAAQLDKVNQRGIKIEPKVVTSGEIIFYKDDGYALDGSLKVSLVGTDADTTDIKGLVKGTTAKEAKEQDIAGIWISEFLAEKLQAKIGNSLIVSAKTAGGSYEAIDAVILGFFTATSVGVNMSQVFISSSILENYLNVDIKSQATNILFNKPSLKLDISGVPGLTYHNWQDLSEDLIFMQKFQSQRMNFFNMFMTLIVCIGVINTMLMSVYERMREIGIMRAYGIRNKELIYMFMNEGLAMGILSSVVGIILGFIIIIPLIYIGIDLSSSMGLDTKMSGPVILKGAWPFLAVIKVTLYNIFISVLFSAIAALSAVRKTVLQCINA